MLLIIRAATLMTMVCICTAAFAGNTFYNKYSKDIVSGRNTYIYKMDEILPDCSASNLEVSVKTSPRHGTLVISHGPVKNGYKKPLPQAKCPYVVSNGVTGYYQSDRGYKGTDKAVISVTDEAGNTKYTTIYLNIK